MYYNISLFSSDSKCGWREISAQHMHIISCKMARSTKGANDEASSMDESLQIEVLRNVSQLQVSSTSMSVTYGTAGSISDLSLNCCNQRKAKLTPVKRERNGELRNGCCHSTPILGSVSNDMLLKEYFSKLSLPVTPIVPCTGSESHFEQDTTNVLMHRPVGKTLLELAATHQSTTDRLLEFDEIGFKASDPGLISGFSNFFSNHTAYSTRAKNSKATNTDSDVPACVLVKLSKEGPKLPTLQHKSRLKHNGIPEDILTKLHT